MESCCFSDSEKDHFTPPSGCCINVSPYMLMGLFCFSCPDGNMEIILRLFTDPFILPHQQVDKGAIKFVLSGANIMCPGLTSPGAKLYPANADTVVVSLCSQWRLVHIIESPGLWLSHFPPPFNCTWVYLNWLQAIMAEGKQHALCVGVMKMSAESM